MAYDGLMVKLAKRLGIPQWGQFLIIGIVLIVGWALKSYSNIDTKVSNAEKTLIKIQNSITVLAESTPNKDLIQKLLTQIKTEQQKETDGKLEPIRRQLKDVSDSQERMSQEVSQKRAALKIDRPDRVVGIIRAELDIARRNGKSIPTDQLTDFKLALLGIPTTADGYREAVYEVIDYESAARQNVNLAPDPAKIIRRCPLLEGHNNTFAGSFVVESCYVSLDSNFFNGVIFRNCVIRYRGGGVAIHNVRFINCRFVFEPHPDKLKPSEQKLLFAIIGSPNPGDTRVISAD